MTYEEWCQSYRDGLAERGLSTRGECQRASMRSVETFPELVVVRGWLKGHEHWWAKTPSGEIVDATWPQFGDRPSHDDYREFEPGDEVRVGRCIECGVDIMARVQSLNGPRRQFCDEVCAHNFNNNLNW